MILVRVAVEKNIRSVAGWVKEVPGWYEVFPASEGFHSLENLLISFLSYLNTVSPIHSIVSGSSGSIFQAC